MSELRPGCKALVIGGFYRVNDGKAVDVIEFIPNGQTFEFEGQLYADKPPRGDAWLIVGDLICQLNGDAQRMHFALIPGECLLPIDGEDFSNEDERQKELTNG